MKLFYSLFFTHFQIKTGAPCRSERLAKYNQILRWVSFWYKLRNFVTFLSFKKKKKYKMWHFECGGVYFVKYDTTKTFLLNCIYLLVLHSLKVQNNFVSCFDRYIYLILHRLSIFKQHCTCTVTFIFGGLQ